MEIIIVSDCIENSTVNGTAIKELPDGLRKQMIGLLKSLVPKKVKKINIPNKVKNAVFELPNRNISLISLGKLKKKILATIELLGWYLGEHWRSSSFPGVIGGDIHCAECGYLTIPGAREKYCPQPDCPSHKKWEMVIGPSYKPPRR